MNILVNRKELRKIIKAHCNPSLVETIIGKIEGLDRVKEGVRDAMFYHINPEDPEFLGIRYSMDFFKAIRIFGDEFMLGDKIEDIIMSPREYDFEHYVKWVFSKISIMVSCSVQERLVSVSFAFNKRIILRRTVRFNPQDVSNRFMDDLILIDGYKILKHLNDFQEKYIDTLVNYDSYYFSNVLSPKWSNREFFGEEHPL